MKRGKFEQQGRRGITLGSRSMLLLLALVLIVGGIAGGTLAWLAANSTPVTNTFTPSDIGVKLEETKNDFKMVPGWTINKDPKVTVTAGSEDCYLFVKVEKSGGDVTVDGKTYSFDDFLVYAIDNGWTVGKGEKTDTNLDGDGIPTNVYYRKVEDVTADKVFTILAAGSCDTDNGAVTWNANQVATKPSVTKEMMNAVNSETSKQPKLTFTAYAVQLWKTNKPATDASTDDIAKAQFTPAEAWAQAPNGTPGT